MTEEHLQATISLRGVLFAPCGDVLVVRRASDGGWELPGGRLGPHEDAPDGVRREITEETGIDARVGRPIHAVSWRNEGDSGRFAVYYWCEATGDLDVRDGDDPVTLSHEHTDYAWLPPESASDRLSDVQERAVDVATEVYEP
ncbi:NUDIX hydrolase [Halobellus limi]|jgi:8-oxo-dGTP pyrophosphatase MutT (NUDIX family)|uniref:NUDIX domain-containing protein n=1 Tax=Halobellus limi TaxID=699433 RepID=A0A1H6C4P9_9EURY|nr:NUDIX domain-containing protein [Halobellus limi]QCC48623.1 NUDIX domain-containing protein [Halobellus limi]SEG67934.1 NUDIX domain-containing protein [Halobellus limi]